VDCPSDGTCGGADTINLYVRCLTATDTGQAGIITNVAITASRLDYVGGRFADLPGWLAPDDCPLPAARHERMMSRGNGGLFPLKDEDFAAAI
jgi:hypothetical protein